MVSLYIHGCPISSLANPQPSPDTDRCAPANFGRPSPAAGRRAGGKGGGGDASLFHKKKLGFGVSNDDVIHNIMFSMGEAWMHEGI